MLTEVEEIIARARRVLWGLDYDGTLVPLAPTPQMALPPSGLLLLLARLVEVPGCQVAVVSGRSLADLGSLLPVPGLILVGLHGAVYRLPGEGEVVRSQASHRDTIKYLLVLARQLARREDGFLVEDKGVGLALHYRQVDTHQADLVRQAFTQAAAPLLARAGLTFLQGQAVLEVRPLGVDKGEAMGWLLRRYPGSFPVYVGDDTTDEDAFRSLAGQGVTIKVGATQSLTAADYVLAGPEEVISLLERFLAQRSDRLSTAP